MKTADFSWPDTTDRPPLLFADKQGGGGRMTPEDIIGPKAYDVKKHYEIYCSRETDEQRGIAFKRGGVSFADLEIIAEIYQGLRDNGWYLTGVDGNGRLMFSAVTDSWPTIEREYTPEECKEYRQIFKKVAEEATGPLGQFLKSFL